MGEKVSRFVGQCQFCEHQQRLDRHMSLVHHGYERPGEGFIVGDCPGVGFPPYERSCNAIKTWLEQTRSFIASTEKRIGQHERRELPVTGYRVIAHKPWEKRPDWTVNLPVLAGGKVIEHDTIVLGPAEPEAERAELFDRLNDQALRKARGELASLRAKADYLQKRINDWQLREIITFEEFKGQQQRAQHPLAASMSMRAAKMGQTMAGGRKPMLYLDPLVELLGAIGWRTQMGNVAIKAHSNNRESLPIVERLQGLGVDLPTGNRLHQTYMWKPGELSINNRWHRTEDQQRNIAWQAMTMEALGRAPSAPPGGPREPFAAEGIYLEAPRTDPKHEGDVLVNNVWIVVPALSIATPGGQTFELPLLYGVNYDKEAIKPAGFYAWASKAGMKAAIESIPR